MSDYLKANNLYNLDNHTNIIVYGYIKAVQPFLFSTIPSEILSITLSYIDHHFMLHRGWYEWNINAELLKIMITANASDSFVSDKFTIAGLKWQLNAYPNGYNDANSGSFIVFLHVLSSLPSSWISITIRTRLYCHETKSSWTRILTYNQAKKNWGWDNHCLLLKDIHDLNADKLKFVVYIQTLTIDTKKQTDKPLYKYAIELNRTKTQRFAWKIEESLMNIMKNARQKQPFLSPLFYDMWCLAVYPNGKDIAGDLRLELRLCALPIDSMKVTASWKINCEQLSVQTEFTNDFEFNDNNYSWGWGVNKLSYDDFKKFDSFAFAVEINYEEDEFFTRMQWEQYIEGNKKREKMRLSDCRSIGDNMIKYEHDLEEMEKKMKKDLICELLEKQRRDINIEMKKTYLIYFCVQVLIIFVAIICARFIY